jgi:hypothetical protein
MITAHPRIISDFCDDTILRFCDEAMVTLERIGMARLWRDQGKREASGGGSDNAPRAFLGAKRGLPSNRRSDGGRGCARPADGPVKWRVASRRRVEAGRLNGLGLSRFKGSATTASARCAGSAVTLTSNTHARKTLTRVAHQPASFFI